MSGKKIRDSGLSRKATEIICSSWRKGTAGVYDTHIKRWKKFAYQRKISTYSPTIEEAINFLASLFSAGLSCSAICTARSALSGFLDIKGCASFGHDEKVKRFIKGVYELRPSFPKYSATWDVDIVLAFLENMTPVEQLTDKEVSHKLAMLIALLSGQRSQTIHCLDTDFMTISDNKCVFRINSKIKQSKRGKHLKPIELMGFRENPSLCVIETLKEYLKRTETKRKGSKQLFISYQKPFKPISKDTLARWLRDILTRAGIDTDIFGAHSTRAASTSAAVARGTPIDQVLKAAGWASESIFTKYYKKVPTTNMGQVLLDHYFKNT